MFQSTNGFSLTDLQFDQEGGVPRAVELLLETAQEAKPTLLGQPRAEVLTQEKAAVPGSEAAQA